MGTDTITVAWLATLQGFQQRTPKFHELIGWRQLRKPRNTLSVSFKNGVAHEFDAVEFLARLCAHIPRPYESITRYYGRDSSRSRGERLKAARVQAHGDQGAGAVSDEKTVTPNSSWAILIKRIYEVDPLECPRCHSTMKLTGIILNPTEIRAFMRSLGIPLPRAPAKFPKAPDLPDVDTCPEYD